MCLQLALTALSTVPIRKGHSSCLGRALLGAKAKRAASNMKERAASCQQDKMAVGRGGNACLLQAEACLPLMNPNSLVYCPLLGPQMRHEARPGRTLGHKARRAVMASAGGQLLGEMQPPLV